MATVRYFHGHKSAPILTSGDVSPAIIAQFIEYLDAYFHKSKIADTDKVRETLTSFQDIRIDNWVKNNRDRFLAEKYTFSDFTAELRKRFLDPHWENMIIHTVVNSQMSKTESFVDFANRVMQGNNLLIGTPFRLNPNDLRTKLEINMTGYLAKMSYLHPAEKKRIKAIEVFEDWYDEICTIDRNMTADRKRISDFVAEYFAKRQRTDQQNAIKPSPLQNSSAPNNPQYSSNSASGASTTVQGQHQDTSQNVYIPAPNSSAPTAKRTRCPKLLPSECELLAKHNGCRKCRRLYVNHRVADCPNDFPNPNTYMTLTEDMVIQARNFVKNSSAVASKFRLRSTNVTPSM